MRYACLIQGPKGDRIPTRVFNLADGILIQPSLNLAKIPDGIPDHDIQKYVIVNGEWVHKSLRQEVELHEGLLWNGLYTGYYGYSKANREILTRLDCTIRLQLMSLPPASEFDDHEVRQRMDAFRNISVKPNALVSFRPPEVETIRLHRICWTMMETLTLHPKLRDKLNANYDEIWVPTRWNKDLFVDGGVAKPVHVMPLGVNALLYDPRSDEEMPMCRLLTTSRAGTIERPEGFIVLTVGTPTFRKNLGMIAQIVQQALGSKASLVLGTTWHADDFGIIKKIAETYKQGRLYVLDRPIPERQMVGLYGNSHVYITLSHGEGWNLPLVEAASCRVPVIAPNNTSHLDVCTKDLCWMVEPQGSAIIPDNGRLSPWFEGQRFCVFGTESIDQTVAHLRDIWSNYTAAMERAEKFRQHVISNYTWERAVGRVTSRIAEFRLGSSHG
jgi:glycosyltransferase involved in cell wall biosynthesis